MIWRDVGKIGQNLANLINSLNVNQFVSNGVTISAEKIVGFLRGVVVWERAKVRKCCGSRKKLYITANLHENFVGGIDFDANEREPSKVF